MSTLAHPCPASEEVRNLIIGSGGASFCHDAERAFEHSAHRHDHHQLVLTFEDGKAEIIWPDGKELKSAILTNRSFCLIPAGVSHSCRWTLNVRVVVLYIHRRLLADNSVFVPDTIFMVPFKELCWRTPVLSPMADDLRGLMKMSSENNSSAALIGASLIARTIEAEAQRLARSEFTDPPLSESEILKLEAFIAAKIGEKLDCSTLAKVVGLSPDHFRKVFKSKTGSTPMHYLLEQRTAKAAELLRSGKCRVVEAAMQTGFADQSHLNRNCRRFYGCSPKSLIPR